MPDEETHVTLSPGDYEAIEAAVMETSRGRWFLREYARRNRNADTKAVLSAIAGLERKLTNDETARTMEQIRSSLLDMEGAIAQTRRETEHAALSDDSSGEDGPLQDETERRIARILETLRYLEGRIQAMMSLCDGDLAPTPLPAGSAQRFRQTDLVRQTLN